MVSAAYMPKVSASDQCSRSWDASLGVRWQLGAPFVKGFDFQISEFGQGPVRTDSRRLLRADEMQR